MLVFSLKWFVVCLEKYIFASDKGRFFSVRSPKNETVECENCRAR